MLTLLEFAWSYTYSANHRNDKWKEGKVQSIINVYPKFNSIPHVDSDQFERFCWSELHLYKHFYITKNDIGLTKEIIITNWTNMSANGYHVWHVNQMPKCEPKSEEEEEQEMM